MRSRLAVVVARKGTYITKEHDFEYIAGYALHNDYFGAQLQLERGGQWVKGKSADTFVPLGPWLVTPDEIEQQVPAHVAFLSLHDS